MLQVFNEAVSWANSHGLLLPFILSTVTVAARLFWVIAAPTVKARWPQAVPIIENGASRVAAVLPDILAAFLPKRKEPPADQQDGQKGSAPVGVLVIVAAVGLALMALMVGCPKVMREPEVPAPPPGCTQGATVCHEGTPWRCGPGGRWAQADRRCDRMGAVCCAAPSVVSGAPIHTCTMATSCLEAAE
jgi:hypothetical protein